MLDLGVNKFIDNYKKKKSTQDDIIVCAAILEKPDKVNQLLKDGANVNVKFFYQNFRNGVNYNSSTALMCAAEKGNETIVRILLENNVDVDVKADNGWSALSYAIKSKNINIVKLLGNKTLGNNGELLMTVVKMFNDEHGQFDLQSFVEIILNIKGVDVNFTNSEGQTPLMYLVVKNKLNSDERLKTISETAGKIIKSKVVDLNAQDNSGKTALMYFIEKNPTFDDAKDYYNNIILDIIQKANANLQDKDGKTALFYAVIAENVVITKAILLQKANANLQDNLGKTALFYAKDPEMVKLLLSKGKISVDKKDNSGKTALFYAPPMLIEPLVDLGANVNMQDDNLGKTALFCTENKQMAGIYYAEMMAKKVEKLLEKGADVTIVDNEGNDVIKTIIEKLGEDIVGELSLGVLMEILKTVPDLDISFKNQKGYNVITYLFSKDLETRKTKMIDQVLKYCYENLAQNENLFNHVYEVEYYITYIKNEMKKKKENTEEFKNIIGSLEIWKEHVDNRPGSEGERNSLKRLGEMAIDYPNYPSKQPKNKFGGRPRRRSTLRVPSAAFANDFAVSRPAKRRSYIKKKSLAKPATGANLRPRRSGRRRSKRKTTVRYSPSRKCP